MELQRRRAEDVQPERKGQKRKLEEETDEDHREMSAGGSPDGATRQAILAEVLAQVEILKSTISWNESDRSAAKRATHVLAELANNVVEDVVNLIVEGGSHEHKEY